MPVFDIIPTYRTNVDAPEYKTFHDCAGLSGRRTPHPKLPNKQSREANLFDRLVTGSEALTLDELADVHNYLITMREDYQRSIEAFRTEAGAAIVTLNIEAAGSVIAMFSRYVEYLTAAIGLLQTVLDDTVTTTAVGQ